MIDYADLMTKAERLRRHFGEDNNSPINVFAMAQSLENLTLVLYPMGTDMSGMCIKGDNGNCTIAINSQMTVGRQRFSLAHEFYHLFYDETMMSVCAKHIGTGNDTERKADVFASFFLMPRGAVSDKAEQMANANGSGKLTLQDVIRIEQYFEVSHQTALYQLRNCGFLSEDEIPDFLNISVRRQALMMGYSDALYRQTAESKQYCTYGHYIDLAEQLLKRELISDGKYEELLLDAYRPDLVYGTDEGGEIID